VENGAVTFRLIPFDKTLRKLSNEYQRRIKQAVDEILETPQRNSKFAEHQWHGKRERRVGDLRLMYSYCKECRQDGHETYNNCPDCDTTPDDTATFYDIIEGHKF